MRFKKFIGRLSMEQIAKNKKEEINSEEYLEKLKKLPPIDKKTEMLLRALANAMLDRIVEKYNNSDISEK